MKITLEHEEIDQALIDFVRKQGLNVSAGDIEIKVQDGRISASVATRFLTAAATTPSVPVAAEPTPTHNPVPEVEDADREAMKTQLNKLGIEYAPKARTATLQSLLEEAQAAAPTFPPEQPDPQQSLPFDVEPAPTAPKVEEPDDDKPLFGV